MLSIISWFNDAASAHFKLDDGKQTYSAPVMPVKAVTPCWKPRCRRGKCLYWIAAASGWCFCEHSQASSHTVCGELDWDQRGTCLGAKAPWATARAFPSVLMKGVLSWPQE